MKKNITKINIIILSILLSAPLTSFAGHITGHPATSATIKSIILDFVGLIDNGIVLVASLALLYFFWGLGKFILNAGSEEKRSEGKSVMVWGIIALFVMVSVWGIVNVLENTFF